MFDNLSEFSTNFLLIIGGAFDDGGLEFLVDGSDLVGAASVVVAFDGALGGGEVLLHFVGDGINQSVDFIEGPGLLLIPGGVDGDFDGLATLEAALRGGVHVIPVVGVQAKDISIYSNTVQNIEELLLFLLQLGCHFSEKPYVYIIVKLFQVSRGVVGGGTLGVGLCDFPPPLLRGSVWGSGAGGERETLSACELWG